MATFKNKHIGSLFTWLLIFGLLAVEGKADDEPISNIVKLRHDLLAEYDKVARPVKNASASVPVRVQMSYITLTEVNEMEETITLQVVMILNWKDEHLKWNPKAYSGLKKITFGDKEIWRPDIFVLESSPVTENIPWNNSHILVYYFGYVSWYPPASIKVHCSMALLKPIEERLCNVSIASYTYHKGELDLKLFWTEMSLSDLRNHTAVNPIWEITNVSASLATPISEEFDMMEYSIASFNIRFKRRYDFISDVIVGPRTVAILLTLVMFWLRATSDKKLNLGCLVILVLSGVMLYLSMTVTSASVLTATVGPLRITLFTVTSALLIEVIILNLSRLSDIIRPSPKLIRILSGMVGRIIGVCVRLEYKEESGMVRLPETEDEEISQDTITIEEEWSLVAMALDRLFFVIYAIIFIVIS